MVCGNQRQDTLKEVDLLQHLGPGQRVHLDLVELLVGQLLGLGKCGSLDPNFADVVQERGELDVAHSVLRQTQLVRDFARVEGHSLR